MEDVLEQNDGFGVVDPVELDLEGVKQERSLLPASDNVKLRIRKVTTIANMDNTYRQLNISFEVVDGIQVNGEVKYKGMVVFEKVCYYADLQKYTKDFFKKKQHLVALQGLVRALSLGEKFTINDEFLSSLGGSMLLGDVRQVNNKYTTKDGTEVENMINTIVRFKPLSAEALV